MLSNWLCCRITWMCRPYSIIAGRLQSFWTTDCDKRSMSTLIRECNMFFLSLFLFRLVILISVVFYVWSQLPAVKFVYCTKTTHYFPALDRFWQNFAGASAWVLAPVRQCVGIGREHSIFNQVSLMRLGLQLHVYHLHMFQLLFHLLLWLLYRLRGSIPLAEKISDDCDHCWPHKFYF